MSGLGTLDKKSLWLHQAPASISQASPVSTTLYTVLAQTNRPTRIIGIMAMVTWTVQPTPLEVLVTIDGQTLIFAFSNPVSATSYYATLKMNTADANQALSGTDPDPINPASFLLEGSNVLIQARTTGGTVSNITVQVRYAIQ